MRTDRLDTDMLLRGTANLPKALDRMGFPSVRKGQDSVIAQIMGGKDVLCILPTGSGKSACFIMPTLCLGWHTLVFSPLIALMRDQVQSLQRKGIRAAQMASTQTEAENIQAVRLWMAGELDLFYVAPERQGNEFFKQAMDARPPDFVVADEAHVVSEWSDSFRSSYAHVGDFIDKYNPKVVASFTATMPPEVERDVRRVFRQENAEKILYYPRRNNLKLSSDQLVGIHQLVKDLQSVQGSCIVYCSTIARVQERAAMLSDMLGEEIGVYYGTGLSPTQKKVNMDNFMEGRVRIIVATGAFGMGIDKAQPLNAQVLTPQGWRKMGELAVGDKVTGGDGKPTEVVAIHERGVLPAYRVTFNDGASTVCSDDHNWSVRSAKHKFRGTLSAVKRLSEIRDSLRDTSGNRQQFIPIVDCAEFAFCADLPVDPYVLGALLGDGGLSGPCVKFTTADSWMLEELSKLLPSNIRVVREGRYNYCLTHGKGRPNPLRKALDALGLSKVKSHTKFVPKQYLLASREARVALVQGLLDTDGHVAMPCRTSVVYVTVSEMLRDAMCFLVRSLGGITTFKKKREAHYVTARFPSSVMPFRLPVKVARYKHKVKYPPARSIDSVELVGKEQMRCITVSNSDGLYVTDDFIVTHNSDVRGVFASDMPRSCEDVSQLTGRAGRDGQTSFCKAYWNGESRRTQEFFISNSHPGQADITALFNAITRMADKDGNLHVGSNDLAKASGVKGFLISAAKQALMASKVIEAVSMDSEEKCCLISYKGACEDELFREWRGHVEYLGVEVGNGFLEVEQGLLEDKCDTKMPVIRKKFKEWEERGLVAFMPPSKARPMKLIGSIDQVDFPRLKQKAKEAYEKLDKVKEYIDTPDNEKHAFLENYFGVKNNE